MTSESNSTPSKKTVVITIITILSGFLIWVILFFVVFTLKLFPAWVQALDSILNASFFATLASLSLAAAAFLMGPVNDAKAHALEADEERRAAAGNVAENDKFPHAKRWMDQNKQATQEEIEGTDYDTSIKKYLHHRREHEYWLRIASDISTGKNALISSFFLFIVGLIEALTIDPLADAATTVVNRPSTITSFFSLIASGSAVAWTFVDVIVSVSVLLAGIYYLWIGARYFKMEPESAG